MTDPIDLIREMIKDIERLPPAAMDMSLNQFRGQYRDVDFNLEEKFYNLYLCPQCFEKIRRDEDGMG